MKCSNCGFENNETAKFCNECGEPLVIISNLEDDKTSESIINSSQKLNLTGSVASTEDESREVSSDQTTIPLQLPVIYHNGEERLNQGSPGDGAVAASSILNNQERENSSAIPSSSDSPQNRILWNVSSTMEMPRLDSEERAVPKKFRLADDAKGIKEKKKSKKAFTVILLLVIALLIVIAGTTNILELWGGKTLPDVVGKSRTEATQALEAKGFVVKSLKVKSDDTEDIVLLMDPTAGKRASEGSQIVLQVATPRTVPDVVGKSFEDAKKALDQEGFEKIEYVKVKSNDPENVIISIEPSAGTKAKAATPITVKITEAYMVPDIIGKDEESAVALLKQESYSVTINRVYSDATEGTVVTSNPAVGTKLPSGSLVTIEIAKSRAKELLSLTSERFASGKTFSANNSIFQVVSNDGVSYLGGSKVQTTLTVKEGATLSDGEVVWGSARQRTFTIIWTDNNTINSIS